MIKIINTLLQYNSHSTLKYLHSDQFLEYSMNYFGNFGAESYLLKIRYNKSNFTKHGRVLVYFTPIVIILWALFSYKPICSYLVTNNYSVAINKIINVYF